MKIGYKTIIVLLISSQSKLIPDFDWKMSIWPIIPMKLLSFSVLIPLQIDDKFTWDFWNLFFFVF